MQEEILYTPEELAIKLKLSKYTIYEMIKRGDLEAHRIGRSIRISDKQLETYLMKTDTLENVYNVEICPENGDPYAMVDGVKIYIASNLDGQAKIRIRPEDIILSKETFTSSARNVLGGVVTGIESDGVKVKVTLNVGFTIASYITPNSLSKMNIKVGDKLYAVFKAVAIAVKNR